MFVYSGQGSQWAGMGRRLLADEPAFAAAVAELDPVFVEQVGFSLQQLLAEVNQWSASTAYSRCWWEYSWRSQSCGAPMGWNRMR